MATVDLNDIIAKAFAPTTDPGEVLLDYVVCARFETGDGAEYAQYLANKSVSSSSMIGLLETVKHMALAGVTDTPDIDDITDILGDPDENE